MIGTRNSSLLGKITVFVFICCFSLSAEGKYGGGTGKPNDPYLIYTAEQMNEIGLSGNSEDWDKHFKLMADIDLGQFTGDEFNIIGTDWDHLFTGVFDGNDHTISSFTYTSTGTDHIGIFGYVDCAGVAIKDLGLAVPNIDAGNRGYIGSLIGYLKDGTISNCYVEGGSLAGRYCVGGLVGFIWYGTITNCYSSGDVSGDFGIGALAGYNYGTITNCYATGSVEADGYSGGLAGRNDGAYGAGIISDCYARGHVSVRHDEAGGLVGRNNTGTITNCYSTGSVSGNRYIGELVGYSNGTITDCYSNGGVSGYALIGGLVGFNDEDGKISNCYATGSVFGDNYIGGLVGYNDNIIVDCYTSGNVTGSYTVGGLCGKSTGPSHGTGQSRIRNCFSKAIVTGNEKVGGLIGHSGAMVTGCYSTGCVTGKGDYSWGIGGLIGSNGGNGIIKNCYSTGSVVGEWNVGGLVVYNDGTVLSSFWDIETSGQTTSGGGTGLTTAEMQMASTFVCWEL